MTSLAMLYNTLPNLGEAEDTLANHQFDLVALAKLLAEYSYEFGIYLVHGHCKLSEGEVMLAKGNISQPKLLSEVDCYYPENWLATGEAFEFRADATKTPPPELWTEFNRLTEDTGVLGLYYIGEDEPEVKLEYTDRRKNILEPFKEANHGDDTYLINQTLLFREYH